MYGLRINSTKIEKGGKSKIKTKYFLIKQCPGFDIF